jgi:voltage-gated potassium channel
VRFTLATPKKRFVRESWSDLVLVVIPFFQPVRLLGAFLRLVRLNAAVERTTQNAGRLLGRHKLHLALAWACGLVLIAAVVTPVVEPDSSKIKSFGDGLWWAVVTTTTVGYGDLVPESATGRVIGLVLMLAGVGIIGIITANIASMFLEPKAVVDAEDEDDVELIDDELIDDEPSAVHTEARLDQIDRKLSEILHRLANG